MSQKLLDFLLWFINGVMYRLYFLQNSWLKYLRLSLFYAIEIDHDHYFTQNSDRLKAITESLQDQKSKDIYLNMIKFRQTGNKKQYFFAKVEEKQYFLKELKFHDDEVYIDCGAYGDTIDRFIKHCPHYKQIVAFEPYKPSFLKLQKKFRHNPKITLYNTAVYDLDGYVAFCETGAGISYISENKNNPKTAVKSIDNLNLEKVTFIKMDIEGSELKALKGAEKTISRDKPKLAISIYHSHQDMIEIPEYLHQLIPEYKFYLRQYNVFHETILYAFV
jgi:FkbM family methyltransferase